MAFNILEYNFNYPENWQLVRLGDIAQINPETIGKNTDLKFIKYIDISSVSSHFFEKPKEIAISDAPSRAKRKLKDNDFIISTVRPNLKQYAFLNKVEHNWICSTGFCVVRANNEHLSWYLYSLVSSEIFTDYLTRIADGGAYPAFNPKEIEDAIIPLPDEDSIIKIASFTKNINEKIHLNQQTNQTLEHIAAAIFKSWFVDFDPVRAKADCLANGGSMADANLSAMVVISGKSPDELAQLQADNPQDYDELWQLAEHFPCEWVENAEFGEVPKGWETSTIGESYNVVMGQSPNGESYNEQGNGTLFYQGRAEFGWRFPSPRLFTTEPKRMAKVNDILMSVRAPVGDLNVALENCCIGRGLCALSHKSEVFSFGFYQMKNLKSLLDVFNGEGTVFGSINQKDLKSIQVLNPDKKMILMFDKFIYPIDEQIKNNTQENLSLTKTRDELLPKLLSGEIEL